MSVPELSISLKTQFSGALDSTPYRGQRGGIIYSRTILFYKQDKDYSDAADTQRRRG
jgi:hypothetical protein